MLASDAELEREIANAFSGYSTEQIAEALLRVIERPASCAELPQKAVKRAALFSWGSTARQTFEVLQSVAKGK